MALVISEKFQKVTIQLAEKHTRATHLANFLTEVQMKEFFGCVQDSDMARRLHASISGRDVDKAILKLYGIEMEESE